MKKKTNGKEFKGMKNEGQRENYFVDNIFRSVNWSTGSKIAKLSNSFMATEMLELYWETILCFKCDTVNEG